jgi:hypothetical protein
VRRWGSSGGERPSPLILSQQDGGAEGSRVPGGAGEGGSSPDKAGTGQYRQMVWVRRAGWRGVREEPACDTPLIRRQLEPGGSGLEAVRTRLLMWVGNSRGGRHELPRRPRGMAAAYLWRCRRGIVGLLLQRANHSEHGNRSGSCPAVGCQPDWVGLGAPTAERPGMGQSRRSTPSRGKPAHMGKGGSGVERGRRLQCLKTRR